jgi:uncharacterized membrane protein YedE/YeeE
VSERSKTIVASLVSGILFGVGLVVSGMTRPAKVIGFLDLFGAWDLSLAFVMMGAIGVHFVVVRLIRGRASPLWSARFALPTRRDIDFKLIAGAALFGAGWGIGGYCPGPAVVSLGSGALGVIVFVFAMLAGMWLTARADLAASAHGRPVERPKHREHLVE